MNISDLSNTGFRRGSELFANELMGSSSGASLLLHLLVFQEKFSVQHGCRCEIWNINFSLFYLYRSENVTKENATTWGKMPQSSLGISSKDWSQKHQQDTSWCWLHVTTSPRWDRAVPQRKSPLRLNMHYLVLVGFQPCFFLSSLGYFRSTGTYVSPDQIPVARCSGSPWTSKVGRVEETQSGNLWQADCVLMLKRQ